MRKSPIIFLIPFAFSALLICAAASFVILHISIATPPCAEANWILIIVRLAVPISFLISALIAARLMLTGGWRTLAMAIAVPALANGAYCAWSPFEASRQVKCESQSWQEAIASCGANPAHVRLGKGAYGYPTLTLYAPGTTDRSWSCLEDWGLHNGHFSMKIDESVYTEARKIYQREQSIGR